jgi:hypothetical protein
MYKESNMHIHPAINILTYSRYQGLQKLHDNTEMPKKKSKKNPLTKEDKMRNRELSSHRVRAYTKINFYIFCWNLCIRGSRPSPKPYAHSQFF